MANGDDRLQTLQGQIRTLQGEGDQLQARLTTSAAGGDWAPRGYYTTYHILAGMVLGFIGAGASLLLNIVGAAMLDMHPLHLIQVYLTFPLGEKALELNIGFALAAG